MVLLDVSEAPDAWELVRGGQNSSSNLLPNLAPSSAASSTGPVLIFVAASDPDALAAVRVLTALLKADLVRYEVHPVAGYDHLRDKFTVLVTGSGAVEPRAVLCVNCGAKVDMEQILRLKPSQHSENDDNLNENDVRVFIVDSHRPYHLRNIKSDRVVLFNDVDDFNRGELPLDMDWEDEWGNVSDDDSDSSDSEADSNSDRSASDDENVLESDEEAPVSSELPHDNRSSPKRARSSKASDDEAGNDELEDIEEDDVVFDGETPRNSSSARRSTTKKHRKRSRDSAAEKRKSKRKRQRMRRRAYDSGYPQDNPEAEERERLREYYSNSTVAMSTACLSHSIAAVLRRSNLDTLWMAIIGVTSQYLTSSISEELYTDALGYFQAQVSSISPDDPEDEDGSRLQNVGYTSSCKDTTTHRVVPNVELRLDLLRHWTLYDSLLYSSYTVTRLAAWRQTGKRRLLEMLATLGIPLRESQQQWCYMKEKNKVALERHLEVAIKRFDLGEAIQYDSFVRTMPGYRGYISAADFVHSVTALLEFDDSNPGDRNGSASASLLDRFWRAYDALDSKRTNLLEGGLEMAISAQKLTADIGSDVIERRKFVPSGPFRYVFLRDQQCKEFLAHPLLLRRLALFLANALLRQGAKDKPFIVLAPDTVRGVWVAVAATNSSQRNDFGHRFQKAADRNGSQVTYDGFDSSVCEIQDGQEIEFVRFLHDVMR